MLNILSEKSMLQMTIDRLRKLHNVEDILIVTRADLADSIRKHVSGVPAENIIIEPEGKNTAPCISLAALHIAKRKKNSIMGVFPADHLIVGYKEFEKAINTASFLAKKDNSLVTIGIQPTFPSIAYGYIQYKSDSEMKHMNAYSVKAFAEKPHLDLAKRFLKSKDFLWNGGIFIWSIATFMKTIKLIKSVNGLIRVLVLMISGLILHRNPSITGLWKKQRILLLSKPSLNGVT